MPKLNWNEPKRKFENSLCLLWVVSYGPAINNINFHQTDGDDDLKKRQLMELAILNGTYRDPSARCEDQIGLISVSCNWINPLIADKENEQLMRTQLPGLMRHPSVASLGSPLILGPPGGMIRQLMTPGGVPSLMHGNDGHTSFLYDPYTFTQYPMSHLIAADFGSSTGQQMDSMSTGGFQMRWWWCCWRKEGFYTSGRNCTVSKF